ncbi:tail fiber assembly protein [Pantoea sp. Acro-807]|uniref:tail fiber assembly protein n=1 Tax=Pantoea sp. Acro-807 TaxID=2608356 RepID=UPI001FFD1851|nr:tail fiber assembly protein [Pantoea sp. Acro-807]
MMAIENKAILDESGLAVAAGLITVYNFAPDSGLYMGATEEHLTAGVGIPAHSTCAIPKNARSGKVNVYVDGRWQKISDHRGETIYSTLTGTEFEVSQPGEYPADTTTLKPTTPFDFWNGVAWQTDTEAQQVAAIINAEAERTALISEANSVTQAWQTQLLLGIIKENDRVALTAWMKYLQAVQDVEVSDVGKIAWPNKPH